MEIDKLQKFFNYLVEWEELRTKPIWDKALKDQDVQTARKVISQQAKISDARNELETIWHENKAYELEVRKLQWQAHQYKRKYHEKEAEYNEAINRIIQLTK